MRSLPSKTERRTRSRLSSSRNCARLRSRWRSKEVRWWFQQPANVTFGPLLPICDVRFSNRPFEVKRIQTIHHCGVDVARGLVLLFGIGTRALPSWDSKTRWNNLSHGLTVSLMAGSSGRANSPHPSSREGHHSTTRWNSSFLLSRLILHGSHAAAASRVHRNSVQPRCGA